MMTLCASFVPGHDPAYTTDSITPPDRMVLLVSLHNGTKLVRYAAIDQAVWDTMTRDERTAWFDEQFPETSLGPGAQKVGSGGDERGQGEDLTTGDRAKPPE